MPPQKETKSLRNNYNSFSGTTFTNEEWTTCEKLKTILSPIHALSKILEGLSLTPGEFYAQWKEVIYKLSGMDDCLARRILRKLVKSTTDLLEGNPALLSGIYVDPNYRVLLNGHQQQTAKTKLVDLAVQMEAVFFQRLWNTVTVCNSSGSSASSQPMERFQAYSYSGVDKQHHLEVFKLDATVCLQAVDAAKPTPIAQKNYVLQVISNYPERLRKAALVATAFPTTNAGVERIFLALKVFQSGVHGSDAGFLDSIAFLRTNGY